MRTTLFTKVSGILGRNDATSQTSLSSSTANKKQANDKKTLKNKIQNSKIEYLPKKAKYTYQKKQSWKYTNCNPSKKQYVQAGSNELEYGLIAESQTVENTPLTVSQQLYLIKTCTQNTYTYTHRKATKENMQQEPTKLA